MVEIKGCTIMVRNESKEKVEPYVCQCDITTQVDCELNKGR